VPLECTACHHQNRLIAAFCGSCGLTLAITSGCPHCGAANPRGQSYCNSCGLTLESPQVAVSVSTTPSFEAATAQSAPLLPPQPSYAPAVQASPLPIRSQGLEMALYGGAAVVAAVALFARLRLLGSSPGDGFVVERALVDAATRVWVQGWIGLGPDTSYGQPPALAYLLAPWIALFGDSIATARGLVAALGIATLGLFFILVRGLIGSRAAALGSALMAVGVWPIYFSRLATPVALLLVVELLSLYLMTKALDERQNGDRRSLLLVLAGASFGVGVYAHNAFFIFAAVMALLWVREYIASGPKSASVVKLAVVFLLPAVVVALPYLIAVAGSWDEVSANTANVWVTRSDEYQSLTGVADQVRHIVTGIGNTTASLLLRRDSDGRSGARLLDPVTALLTLIGLAAGVARWHRRGHATVWLLLAASVVVVGLTTTDGMHARLVVALPAVFASAGFGLHWLLTWMRGRLSVTTKYAVIALLIAFVAYQNIGTLFDAEAGPGGEAWLGSGPGAASSSRPE
jgi:4-amino-4-deoxy-L-arabinose transferase-like glycosyltransferase